MKRHKVFVLFAFSAFAGGSILAQFYSSSVKNKPSTQALEQTKEMGSHDAINNTSQQWKDMPAEKAAKIIISMSDERLAFHIMTMMAQSDFSDLRIESYALWMIERLMKNDPDKAVGIMCSNTFSDASDKACRFYGTSYFDFLAGFYPDRFINDLCFINEKNKTDKLSRLNASLIESFFRKLTINNPRLAYVMLTDERIVNPILSLKIESTEIEYDAHGVPFKKDNRCILSELRSDAMSKIGLSDILLLDQYLSSISPSERFNFIRRMAYSTSPEQLNDTVAWAKGRLNKSEWHQFNDIVFSMLLDRSKDPVVLGDFLRMVELTQISDWQLQQYVKLLAETDPLAAIDFVEEKMQGRRRENGLGTILSELIRKKAFNNVLPILQDMPEGVCKQNTLMNFYYSDPEMALKWVIDNEEISFLRGQIFNELSKGEERGREFQKKILDIGVEEPFVRRLIIEQTRWRNRAQGEAFVGELDGEKQRVFASDFYGDWLRNGDDLESCVEKMKTSEVLGDNKATVIREAIAEIAHTYPPDRLARSLSALDDPSMLPYAAEQYVWAFDGKTVQDGTELVLEKTMESDIPDNLKQAIRTAWEAKRNGAAKPQDLKRDVYWSGI